MAKVSIIPEDYDSLQKENKVLKSELENVNQELYGCKRQLKIFEALQNEYQSEIEILQSEHDIENQKLKEKIVHLEENLNETRIKYNEHIQSLEADLAKKEEENVSLQAKIELLKKVQLTQAPADDVNKLLEELASLKDEKDALLFNEEDLNLTVEILQKKNLKLEETLAEHREEVSNLKENLSCKREELFEANDLIQKLNNEMVYLKNELDLFKSKPLNEKSKGNSLFAEVDDRRVYLQKTINNMKTEYVCMKQERAKHLNMISHLRKENKTLCDRWKADTEEMEDDRDMVLKGHKDRIKILETLIENYKKDLSAKPLILSSGSFNEMEFYQSLLDRKTKEIEELRDQISARGLTQTILTTSLKEANREIRKWKLEATLKQCQIELNTSEKLSDSKVSEILDDVMENRSIKSEQVKKRTKAKQERVLVKVLRLKSSLNLNQKTS
ncbi:hypothetical protein NQ317_015140 [Molorchus minor]|uniref:Uncharacterized protein n=1 Tax=Molorchus minor TaxID=1323400 RepID=A0ABQ9K713_9CUCU|nr:hypothetical protein NQ317_015140 [Molorchus minor]